MIALGREEFRTLARTHTVVPVWRTVLADLETPLSAFVKLVGDGEGFLLESTEQAERWGRFSFIGRNPSRTFVVRGRHVEWTDGAFRVKGAPDKAKTIPQLAFSAWTAHSLPKGTEPHLNGTAVYDPPNFTWPGGAHVCVVEVDVETGQTTIVDYVGVDDCGTIINPMIVEGQVHGGIAQGVAEALYEEAVYDDEGNLTTSSLVQYLVPSANEIPTVKLDHIETPSTTNPLGVKGIGEAGTIASPPAVVNAVNDAVAHLGVGIIQKPASPERVWRAIRAAKGGAK